MAKFKVGDRARLVKKHPDATGNWPIGTEVEIISTGERGRYKGYTQKTDYTIAWEKKESTVMEWQLEPVIDLGSWDELQKTINWNPTKELNHVE